MLMCSKSYSLHKFSVYAASIRTIVLKMSVFVIHLLWLVLCVCYTKHVLVHAYSMLVFPTLIKLICL